MMKSYGLNVTKIQVNVLPTSMLNIYIYALKHPCLHFHTQFPQFSKSNSHTQFFKSFRF